jgi:hypothetical protein
MRQHMSAYVLPQAAAGSRCALSLLLLQYYYYYMCPHTPRYVFLKRLPHTYLLTRQQALLALFREADTQHTSA